MSMKLPTGNRYKIDANLSQMKRSQLGEQFAALHRQLQKTDKSMLVIIDGWESSGKGFLLKDLTRELDTKKYEVAVFDEVDAHDMGYPYLRRFMKKIPRKGQIVFFDRSFYYKLMHEHQWRNRTAAFKHLVDDIHFLEHALEDDGTLVVKLFLHQTESEMKKNIKSLEKDPYRIIRRSGADEYQLKYYKYFKKHFELIIEETNDIPWHILYCDDQKDQSREALQICINELTKFINEVPEDKTVPLSPLPTDELPLSKIDYTEKISEEEYRSILEKLQKRAGDLLYQVYFEGKSVIVAYEGTDAAGKGGNIQRLTRYMDPRGYDVTTVSAPDATEFSYHYLWRFYRDFPSKGRMTIFDRSWYGRVLVERIESLAPQVRWQEAYAEINKMEHNLTHQGILVLKYFIMISKEEQYKRFKERETNPEKQYKLTSEDWRNHKKYDEYLDAMNEMLLRTSTEGAPWLVVSGMDKRHARITVLKDFIQRLEAYLKK